MRGPRAAHSGSEAQARHLAAVKTLEGYDFAFASRASLKQIMELGGMAFLERRENIVLLGPSGVGKTHIGCALALKATQAGIKTRFISAADLMVQLSLATAQSRITEYMNRAVIGPRLLVIDELSYLPLGREEANLFFHFIAKRYGHSSTIVTSNLPFTQWASTLADYATLTAALLGKEEIRRRHDQSHGEDLPHPASDCTR